MKICSECFKNYEIKEMIKSNNIVCNCDINKEHTDVYTLETSEDSIILSSIQNFLKQIIDLYTLDHKLPPEFPKRQINLLKNALRDDWPLFTDSIGFVASLLESLFTGDENFDLSILNEKVGIIEEGDTDHPDLIINGNDWHQFVDDLKHANRFHPNKFNGNNLTYFLKYSSEHLKNSKNKTYYRARISNEKELDCNDMYAPPKEYASAGRLNSRWISTLYLSDNKDATIQEVRAVLNDRVYIGEFNIKKESLRLVNFVNFYEKVLNSDVDFLKYYLNRNILKEIQKELSRPTNKDKQEITYIPLQFLSDFVKAQEENYDGILYESIMQDNAVNLMLFNQELTNCYEVNSYIVNSITYNFK